MDKKTIYDAICGIDEKNLREYDENCNTIKKQRKAISIIISGAACFIVVIGVLYLSATGILFPKNNLLQEQTAIKPDISMTSEDYVIASEKTTVNNKVPTTNNNNAKNETNSKWNEKSETISYESKGGNTSETIQDLRIGTDGNYYKVFKPGIDSFEPIENMTLENRFCDFTYNGYSYYPAQNGNITKADYETTILKSVKASHWELRSVNEDDEVSGVVYFARIDIHKLKGIETNEAVACVISFNGETKEYKYNATEILEPSWP